MKKRTIENESLVCRERLLRAVENTHDEATFFMGIAVDQKDSFLKGLQRNRSELVTKHRLLETILSSPFEQIPRMPGHENYLVLSEHEYVSRNSINEAQVFPQTPNVDGFIHATGLGRPWYDVYYQIDRTNRVITFALGSHRRTIPLEEHTRWAWKLTRTTLRCATIERLARSFQDDFWSPLPVQIGRAALHIADVI